MKLEIKKTFSANIYAKNEIFSSHTMRFFFHSIKEFVKQTEKSTHQKHLIILLHKKASNTQWTYFLLYLYSSSNSQFFSCFILFYSWKFGKSFYFYKNLFNFFWCFYVFYKKCVFSLVQRFFQYCFNFFFRLIFLQITGCVKFAPHKPLE